MQIEPLEEKTVLLIYAIIILQNKTNDNTLISERSVSKYKTMGFASRPKMRGKKCLKHQLGSGPSVKVLIFLGYQISQNGLSMAQQSSDCMTVKLQRLLILTRIFHEHRVAFGYMC